MNRELSRALIVLDVVKSQLEDLNVTLDRDPRWIRCEVAQVSPEFVIVKVPVFADGRPTTAEGKFPKLAFDPGTTLTPGTLVNIAVELFKAQP